jgi:hypothetical protein
MLRLILLASTLVRFLIADPLNVEVYTVAKVPDAVLDHANQVLDRILSFSSIQVSWTLKDPAASEGQLLVHAGNPKPGIETARASCAAKRSITVRITPYAPLGYESSMIGFALPFAPRGVNVVVYFDRILDKSAEHGIPTSVLLAHALAHEIGHVLLRNTEHTENNLMAESWRKNEFARIRLGGMYFEPWQTDQILSNLAGAGCRPDPVPVASALSTAQ